MALASRFYPDLSSLVILQQHCTIPAEAAVAILRKEKITIDLDDPAAVKHYANLMKTIRQKADMNSESQRIQYDIETESMEMLDARAYLSKLWEIRTKKGLTDEHGAEAMMFEALDKVEKGLKKPLMRDDKKGMTLLMSEFDKINKNLGVRRGDLPKYEEELELKIAEIQLEEVKKDALTQKKKLSDWSSICSTVPVNGGIQG